MFPPLTNKTQRLMPTQKNDFNFNGQNIYIGFDARLKR
jgi:hypothetical protein